MTGADPIFGNLAHAGENFRRSAGAADECHRRLGAVLGQHQMLHGNTKLNAECATPVDIELQQDDIGATLQTLTAAPTPAVSIVAIEAGVSAASALAGASGLSEAGLGRSGKAEAIFDHRDRVVLQPVKHAALFRRCRTETMATATIRTRG